MNSLKNEVIRAVGLHDLVLANCIAGPNLDSQSLKTMDAVNDAAVHPDRCVGGFTLRCPPIAAAKPFIDRDGARAYIVPP